MRAHVCRAPGAVQECRAPSAGAHVRRAAGAGAAAGAGSGAGAGAGAGAGGGGAFSAHRCSATHQTLFLPILGIPGASK